MFALATIVEGPGDVAALPVLLRRLRPGWSILRPIRLPRSKLLGVPNPADINHQVLDRYVQTANAAIDEQGAAGGILLVYDADDDCPRELGPKLREIARRSTRNQCQVVMCMREFEAWILAGQPEQTLPDPELPRDPKGLLRQRLGVYSETADQPRLAAAIDIDRARQSSRSFRYLLTALDRFDAPQVSML